MKRILLPLVLLLAFISGYSADRFWVGGSGNWIDRNHWSEKSGGTAGASIPTAKDDVIFDSQSFLSEGEAVTIETAASFHNMNWKGVSHSPILVGPSAAAINIYGSLALDEKMQNQFKGKIFFKSFLPGNTIFSANHFFLGDLVFDNVNGEWKFLDDIRTINNASIIISGGILSTNDRNVNCYSVISYGNKKRGLQLGASQIVIRGQWNFSNTVNLTFNKGTSEIILSKEKSAKTFLPGNLSYNKLAITNANCNPSGDGCAFFTITLTMTQVTCAGSCNGTTSASIAGGTGPFTYQWDDPAGQTTQTATGLCIGTRLVQVTDGLGNTCVCSISVTSPPTLNTQPLTETPATCNGTCNATVSVIALGGVTPYTYLWSPTSQTTTTATGLCGTTTYTLTLSDANHCTITRTKLVTEPAALVTGGTSTSLTCYNVCTGTASVNPSGGTAPYTYVWAPGGATTTARTSLCAGNYTCTIKDANGCTNNYTTTISQPTQLTATVSGTNLNCNSDQTGTVNATASGGTGAYTYSWAPGGCSTAACTGLNAATYTLTLRDANGCSLTKTVTITQPAALTVAPTATNVPCFGQCVGAVNANAGGGVSPYTYLWSLAGSSIATTAAVTGLCAGNYSVEVSDSHGCTNSNTVAITQPSSVSVITTKTDASCSGSCDGKVTATASGGTSPYTYLWTKGGSAIATTAAVSGLCPGTYSVDVKDKNGCDAASTITVSAPLALATGVSSTPATCFGLCNGTVLSSASGGTSPYTYLWTKGGTTIATTAAVTGLCAGTYSLTLKDSHSCITTTTVNVTQPNLFSATISSATPNPLNCNGDCNGTAATTVTGGTSPYTYLWNTTPVQTTPSVTGLCVGSYTVSVTDSKNCTASDAVTFLQPTPLSVTVTSSDPTCHNSCNGSVSVSSFAGGTAPYTFLWQPGGQSTIGISSQCPNTYTLSFSDSKNCSLTQTVTLNNPTQLLAGAAVSKNVACSGSCDGAAFASPSGGTSPYTYLWSPGGKTTSSVTGLCVGNYTVTVNDKNACSDISVITISQPAILTSSVSSTTSSCSSCNGIASVNTSGGTLPYSYFWSPGGQTTSMATGLCVGSYTVTATDAHGCTNSLTVTISPVVTITTTVSGSNVSCPGSCDGMATATPFGGGNPYTYLWNSAPTQTTATATGLCAGNYTVTITDGNGCVSSSNLTFNNPTPLSSTITATSAFCGNTNGTASVTVSGGTGAYTYTWSGFPIQTTASATGLSPGNYTVSITDANNCATTNTVSVGNIPPISNSPSVTLATCGANDGAICASASGGSPAYSYLWSPGGATTACITGLGAGTYTLVISDTKGCNNTFAIAVGNLNAPVITVNSSVNPTCNASCDGSISITASAGTPPYTYLWTPGSQTTTAVSALCAGTYIIKVMDGVPCTSFSSITLNNPPQFSSNPTITHVSCKGGNNGSICIAPSGGVVPYTYSWPQLAGQSTSCVSGLTAGTYSVIIADAQGCDDTVSIPVTEPALLNISISSTNVTCNGNADGHATANVTGGTTLYTYAWSTGSPLPSIVGLSPANYSLTVTDANGCKASASVTITEPAVLSATITSTNVTCNSACDGTATLNASGGTLPYTYSWLPGGETTSAISGLCNGTYVGTLTDAHGCSSTKNVTISQPAAISPSVTSTNSSCYGGCNGTAIASATGGTGTYTYQWNPGGQSTGTVTGLCAASYTLNVSDANGCMANQFFFITAPAQLQENISSVSPSCFGLCDGTATAAPIGGTGAYTYSWNTSPVQTTATATGLCAKNYTLTLSDANNCSVSKPFTIAAPPSISQANGVASATCLQCNGSISIVAFGGTAPYSYIWSTGATSATITGLCAGVYIDTVKDSKGCFSIDTIPVSNTTGPAITVTHTDVTCFGACNGIGTVTSATGNGPPWIYTWVFTSPVQTTATATGLCPNQYFATVTDTIGCKTINAVNITQPAQIASNASVTNTTCFGICNGNIALNPSGGTPPYTFLWSNGATTSSITGLCAGNYSDTIRDAHNCLFFESLNVGQNIILSSTVTATNDSCFSSCNGTAFVSVSGGASPYGYLWNPANQTTANATGLCAGTQTITTTDVAGCKNISTVTITQPLLLALNISGTDPLCNGNCNGSVTAAPTGGTPPYTFLWNTGATTSSVSGLCAGNYSLTLSDAHHCSGNGTVTLTNPLTVSSTNTVVNASCINTCNGAVNLTPAGGTTPYTFVWFPSAQTTQNISGMCSGIDSVHITDSHGCAASYSINIGVNTLVVAKAGNDTSFCLGGTATLTSSSTNASSLGWYTLPGWTLIGTTPTVNQSPATAGTYTFALIATNGICSDTDTVNVIVNAYPVLISSNDTIICAGDSVKLCSSGATVYQWFTLPAWMPVATGSCITVSPSIGSTNYGIIGMNGMCRDSDTVKVTVRIKPTAHAGNDTINCYGNGVHLCSSSLNATALSWYAVTVSGWTLVDTTVCVTVRPPAGLNNFVLVATNGICNDTDTIVVTIRPAPAVNAGPDVTILATNSTGLTGTGNGTYLWSPATGLSCSTCANPTANPSVTTNYTLTVTDTSGCTASDTIRVTIISDIIVNDGISPNGDGINDVWEIPNIEHFPNALVEVYNRWGELVFHSTNYTSGKWDGKYNGKDLPVGTYYYVINLNSDLKKEPLTGPITILR